MSVKALAPSTIFGLLLLAALTPAHAGPENVGTTAGQNYGEWSAAWWQWAFSIPAAENPLEAQGAIDCAVHQSGAVWFLAGATAGVTAERSCSVPEGKNLFFPVLNLVFVNLPGETFTVEEKRDQLDRILNDTDPGPFADFGLPGTRTCGLFATIDGLSVTRFVSQARTQSPAFPFDTGDGPAGFPPGVFDPEAISDGFWIMLPSLTPGEHTVRFGGRLCEFDSLDDHPFFPPLDVTYVLDVIDE